MKIIKNGNTYRKLSWFEEHEMGLYLSGIIAVGTACFIFLILML